MCCLRVIQLTICETCHHSDSGYARLNVSLCGQTAERTLPTVLIERSEFVIEEEI